MRRHSATKLSGFDRNEDDKRKGIVVIVQCPCDMAGIECMKPECQSLGPFQKCSHPQEVFISDREHTS